CSSDLVRRFGHGEIEGWALPARGAGLATGKPSMAVFSVWACPVAAGPCRSGLARDNRSTAGEDMKLATYKDGSRDGQLVVVSRDLSTAHYATGIAHRLQQVLDDWNFLAPQLEDLFLTLNQGKARGRGAMHMDGSNGNAWRALP
ncbi:hypothetical protein RZS08_14120, partial [Arthrospira platensis SPKY1]|nr:hypothetical protein [Arthrospira platensis SPKY1]